MTEHELAIDYVEKGIGIVIGAVSERVNQKEVTRKAEMAALAGIRAGKQPHEILIAVGDSLFSDIKSTCGVENFEADLHEI